MPFQTLLGCQMTVCSQNSVESRMSLAQVYTKAGTYRGQFVALKRYTRRHMDLTRQMRKDMKMVGTAKAPFARFQSNRT